MIFVITTLGRDEWLSFSHHAALAWPGEKLSRGEVLKRFAVFGSTAVQQLTREQKEALQQQFRQKLGVGRGEFKGSLPKAK